MSGDFKKRALSLEGHVASFRDAWADEPSIAPHMESAPGMTTGGVLYVFSEGLALVNDLLSELDTAHAESQRWANLLGPADDMIAALGTVLVEAGHMHAGNITGTAEESTTKDYQAACANVLAGVSKALNENALLKDASQAPLDVAKRIVADAASVIAAEEWDSEIDDADDVAQWAHLSQRNRDRIMKNVLGAMFSDMDSSVHRAKEAEVPPAKVFSPDDVVKLGKSQVDGKYHPYTCANRGDGKHGTVYGDLGALIPTVNGWICPFCDYKQGWAHGVANPEQEDSQHVTQSVVDNGDGTSDVTMSLPRVAQPKTSQPMRHDIEHAAEIVALHNRASTSFVQMRMKCSNAYARLLIEALEKEGIIAAPNHVGKREVLDFSPLTKAGGFRAVSNL